MQQIAETATTWFHDAVKKWERYTPDEKATAIAELEAHKLVAISCPKCHDAGFIHPMLADKPDYSRAVVCRCRQEQHYLEARRQMYDLAGMNAEDPTDLLDMFKVNPGNKEAHGMAWALAEGDAPFLWLVLHGEPGNGKTMLARGVAQRFLKRNKSVRIVYFPALMSRISASMKPDNKETQESILQDITSRDLLVLDEVGGQHDSSSGWSWAILESIVNRIYEDCVFNNKTRCLVATLNIDLLRLPEPVLSRFSDRICECVLNKAPDYRPGR